MCDWFQAVPVYHHRPRLVSDYVRAASPLRWPPMDALTKACRASVGWARGAVTKWLGAREPKAFPPGERPCSAPCSCQEAAVVAR